MIPRSVLFYLLRHAEAEPAVTGDFSRNLTGKGGKQASAVGRFLADRGLRPELILTSPVLRAKQTAGLVARELGAGVPEEASWLACGMNPERGLAELAGFSRLDSVMIVGHEPDFSALIAHLLDLAPGASVHVAKASLACIELARPVAGSGCLKFLIPVHFL